MYVVGRARLMLLQSIIDADKSRPRRAYARRFRPCCGCEKRKVKPTKERLREHSELSIGRTRGSNRRYTLNLNGRCE
jgi:hypothetical protein